MLPRTSSPASLCCATPRLWSRVAGLLTFHASPVWVMAALADLSGAGRGLISEISEALQQEGLLETDSHFETIDQMLDGLERSAGRVAQALNTPPLDVASLRREWAALREEARGIPPRDLPSVDLVRRNWEALKREAAAQDRPVFLVSSSWPWRRSAGFRRTCSGFPSARTTLPAAPARSSPRRYSTTTPPRCAKSTGRVT